MAPAGPFFEFRALISPTLEQLNVAGREGWSIGGAAGDIVYMQRMAEELPAAVTEPSPAQESEIELLEPLCGCGCGDSVPVRASDYDDAKQAGLAWYAGGHGIDAENHDGAYAELPLPRRRTR